MNDHRDLILRKSPALAGFLSMMPGAGHIYVGYYTAGFTNVLVIAALITLLNSNAVRGLEPFFGLFLTFFWIFNIVDAVRRAKLYNLHAMGAREEAMPTDSPLVGGVLLLILGAFLTLTVTFGLDLDWLENVWPLFLLGAGGYLVFRYRRTKDRLEMEAMSRSARSARGVPGRSDESDVPWAAPPAGGIETAPDRPQPTGPPPDRAQVPFPPSPPAPPASSAGDPGAEPTPPSRGMFPPAAKG